MQFTTWYAAWLCRKTYSADGLKVLTDVYEKGRFFVFDFERPRDPSTEGIQRLNTGRKRKDFTKGSCAGAGRRVRPLTHGTLYAYQYKHCRCEECVKTARAHARARYARKKGGVAV